jgi:putative DNA primase/helicase
MLDLKNIARALGGDVVTRDHVLAPGPGHGRADRSLSIKLSARAPEGLVVHSFAGDDWRECRDYVLERLGRPRDGWKHERPAPGATPGPVIAAALRDVWMATAAPRGPPDTSGATTDPTAAPKALWAVSVDPRGTIVEKYLRSRALDLGDDIAGDVLRWHPGLGAMVALLRDIHTNEPRAASQTFLDKNAHKIERKFMGPVGGAAVKLDGDEAVLEGLFVGEGIETSLAARQLGLKPAWALGSAGAIAAFPVLTGIKTLTLLAENDDASRRAVEACAKRWHLAGREVLVNEPAFGKDLNDVVIRTAE